jgi:ethanolamine transporter
MTFDKIIIIIMAVFLAIGGLDRIFGNHLKLGEAFEKGIRTTGEMMLSMIGVIVLAPVLASVLKPVMVPVYGFLGADAAMFAGTLLAPDMGGAPLAYSLAADTDAARLGGIIAASMLGGTVAFTIPVVMGMFDGEDRALSAKGLLYGVVTIPIGIIVGGLVAGFNIVMVLLNTVPIAIISLLIALGLWKAERFLVKGFVIFGKIIIAVATIGIVAAGVESMTGITLIKGLDSLSEAFIVVGQIGIVLAGAFPLIAVINLLLKKPMEKAGSLLKINAVSISGLMTSLVNSLIMFGMVKDMDKRGKVINMAFAVSAAFVFGDHLAFTAGFDAPMIGAMIAGKLAAGITAVALAVVATRKEV